MAHTFRHNETLSWRKLNHAIFQIDQKPAIQHEKEFIDVFVFVSVILILDDRHPND